MSYSVTSRGADKLRAVEQVKSELDQIALSQPEHVDKYAVQDAVTTLVGLVQQDDTRDVVVSVNGSIYKTDAGVQQVSCAIDVKLAPRA